MSKPLSQKTMDIVTQCIPALEAHGVEITTETYKNLLVDKKIADLFNLSHQRDGSQPRSLATALLLYAQNIKDPEKLQMMVERIAEKHVSLNILPEHYPYVGKALLASIKQVLGDAATEDVMQAWTEAYEFLADIFINREKEIYDKNADTPGGWRGWRKFKVQSLKKESEEMMSFELTPTDGKEILDHKAGQYLGLNLDLPEKGSQRRNYSISSAPGGSSYRISVQMVKDGLVSEWFNQKVKEGQEISLSDPSGNFYLEHDERPVTLISGGSGLTPMISMIGDIVESKRGNKIHYVHSTRTQEVEAFGGYIRTLASAGEVKADIFYTRGTPGEDNKNLKCHEGEIPEEFIAQAVSKESVCYICGPQGFTLKMIEFLKKKGMEPDQIRYELFGSITDPEMAVS